MLSLRTAAITVLVALVITAQTPPSPAPPDSKDAKSDSAAAKKTEAPKPDAPKPEPPKEKPFADVIKDTTQTSGLFNIYRNDDKVLMEIQPSQLDKVYMFSVTCESGLGERGFYAAQMCGQMPIRFHKNGKNIQVLSRRAMFTADAGTPIRHAVDRSFADSVMGSTKIESLAHPDRKSLLIDLGAILLTDVPMVAYELEATYRYPYHFDSKNSAFGKIKAFERNVEIDTVANYVVERIPVPPILPPGATPPPTPPPPRTIADPRSMLFQFRYSISELPETGYRPRIADDRVGHFFQQIEDYSTDSAHVPTKRYINRWQLEKQDPSAALSKPKQPIVFWLENTIPVKYRDAVREGVLMWNKAFERVGFKDAVEVRQQPDDADWEPGDVRYSTIRWFINTDSGFAIGPSRANPFTGQLYDADIGFSENMTRFIRREINESVSPLSMPWESEPVHLFTAPWSISQEQNQCALGDGALRDAEFGLDLLAARGIDPQGPEADAYAKAFLRSIAAHEVGHTLGLRHNFRASTIHTLEQMQDMELTAREGISASVMDYLPANIAPKGTKQGEYYQSTLGPYDYWAIEYAYKPIDAGTPEGELPELRKIAARVADPLLAYATDEDAGVSALPYDMDPGVSRFDLGADPLKFHSLRVRLGQEILENMETKQQKQGEGYQILMRTFGSAFGQAGQSLIMAAKYIGGVEHYRDHFGDANGRLPYIPISPARQKEALALLRTNVFSPDAFQFPPQLLNKLAAERFSDNFNPFGPPRANTRFDVPVHAYVLSLQNAVLNRILHPIVLSRIIDSEVKAAAPAQPFHLSDLFQGLQDSIWAELKKPGASLNINSYRRALQREHLRRMIGMVVRDAASPEDARTLSRYYLTQLQSQMRTALAAPGMQLESRAHLSECAARIDEALKAQMQRQAF